MADFASNAVVPHGTRYGFLGGSEGLWGAGYKGVASMMAPPQRPTMDSVMAGQTDAAYGRDPNHMNELWNQQNSDWAKRSKLFDNLTDSLGSNSNYNFQSWGQPIPQPAWASTAGVWNQGQINNQANSQTAKLYAQAANQTRGYATSAAQRGFSPMSPLTQFMQQTSNQRAGAAGAQNETNLNWTAAAGNRDAQQKGEGINANLYGSYTSALARQQEMRLQAQQQQWQQRMAQQQLLASLVGRA